MTDDAAHGVSPRWAQWRAQNPLDEYASRWQRLEGAGQPIHGEADLIASLHPASVLDAGCGMGRVGIELARRGIDVVGVDLDDDLLAFARRAAPSIPWIHADLASLDLGRTFDVVVMAGNVMVYCRPSDRPAIIAAAGRHLAAGGWLVAGFDLDLPEGGGLDEYDRMCASAGLAPVDRWSTWNRDPYRGGTYVVVRHRRAAEPPHEPRSLH